tara:strand:+ start:452 stop:1555 length:1104 start_codon:yes stop_codon:yes gene_type:complete
MYKVISANRSKLRAPKNWRIFEKESLEKYFGKVIDTNGEDGYSVLETYEKYKDSIEYIRWYPDPELLTKKEYLGMLYQDYKIGDLKYLINSPKGFINVQSKEEAFKVWKRNEVRTPAFFSFSNELDFQFNFENSNIDFPFLIRLNNDVAGNGSYLVERQSDLKKNLKKLFKNYKEHCKKNIGINTKLICVEYIDTVDYKKNVNVSYRIHVAGNKIISGYARISSASDWVAITGKFERKDAEKWIEYNILCEKMCKKHEAEICKAIQVLGLNYQGIDIIIGNENNKIYFLEVQPTYATGYNKNGYGQYYPPFYNPSYPNLVKFLIEEKKYLEKIIPMYYNRWLDKKEHFNLAYKYLKEYLNCLDQTRY